MEPEVDAVFAPAGGSDKANPALNYSDGILHRLEEEASPDVSLDESFASAAEEISGLDLSFMSDITMEVGPYPQDILAGNLKLPISPLRAVFGAPRKQWCVEGAFFKRAEACGL